MATATLTAPAPTAAPVPAAPTTTCAACPAEIPAGKTWCSWSCRNLDDDHGRDDCYEPEND